mgnify:CR=1 FL=1
MSSPRVLTKSPGRTTDDGISSSMVQAEQEILDCAAMTREIASLAWSIEQDTLPKLRGPHVDNMERIFAAIDNFSDAVLPRVNADVAQLEALVDKLEALHESQASPVTSFFSGILRGSSSTPANSGVEALEAQRAAINLHSKDELLGMLYSGGVLRSSTSDEAAEEEEGGGQEEEEEEGKEEEDDDDEEEEEGDNGGNIDGNKDCTDPI